MKKLVSIVPTVKIPYSKSRLQILLWTVFLYYIGFIFFWFCLQLKVAREAGWNMWLIILGISFRHFKLLSWLFRGVWCIRLTRPILGKRESDPPFIFDPPFVTSPSPFWISAQTPENYDIETNKKGLLPCDIISKPTFLSRDNNQGRKEMCLCVYKFYKCSCIT